MFPLKLEAAILIVIGVCVFLSFYFAFLSFCTIDDFIKKQFVAISIYSLIAAVVIFASLIMHLSIKKVLPAVEEQLTESEDAQKFDGE